MCHEGRGGERDQKKAAEYMQVAANGLEAGALYNLSNFCENGDLGFEKDHARAFILCKKSAELGFLRSQCKLGLCFFFLRFLNEE